MKSILDRSFRYTHSSKTDLKKTFAKFRRLQRESEAGQFQADAEATSTMLPIMQIKKKASPTHRPSPHPHRGPSTQGCFITPHRPYCYNTESGD